MSFLDTLGSSQGPAQGGFLGGVGGSQQTQTPAPGPFSQPQSLSDSLWNGLVGVGKSIASPVATMVARPVQAVAELAGAPDAAVNDISSKLSGGLIAPTPQNVGDLKKDIGRAGETVALELGPVAGGAAFGAGNSLEQGNNLFSPTTAVQTITGAVGGKLLDFVGTPIFNAVGKVAGKITPQFLKDVASKGASAITDFAAAHNILPEQVSHVINAAADTANTVANKPFDVAGDAASAVASKARAKVATGDVPFMGQNIDGGVQTSAIRLAKQAPLQGAGAAREATPTDIYNKFANPEELFMGNKDKGILADKKLSGAQGVLGKTVSDAFDQVIALRRGVGATKGAALKAIADRPVNIADTASNFSKNLADRYNLGVNPETKALETINGTQTPLTGSDRKLVSDYIDELHSLGARPTAGELDAFLQRKSGELKAISKPVNDPTAVTKGESLVKNHISSLRGEIDAKIDPKTGIAQNPDLKPYTEAKQNYARLSGIVKRGSKILGGVDSQGRYIRDASSAKRAINSIADGGTKQLLLDIEKETGIPLVDQASLALQAMKDADNPVGHQLLEAFTTGVKSATDGGHQGITERLARAGAGYAKGKVVGSKADQTRAFLKSLEKKKK